MTRQMKHKYTHTHRLTSPLMAAGLASSSANSLRKDEATACSASSGQGLNQSMVQHVTSEGNCLSRARNISPIGLWRSRLREKKKIITKRGNWSWMNLPPTLTAYPRHSPHAEHRVDVAADPANVGGHEVGFSWLLAQCLHHRLHGVQDALLLVRGVQVGNVTRVQDVVDVLQEGLAFNLWDSPKFCCPGPGCAT